MRDCTVRNAPLDFDIFPLSSVRNSPCSQYFTHGFLPRALSLWAISLVWCTGMWSTPPQWMSNCSPRYLIAIAEHSTCHPGKPTPHGLSHSIWRFLSLGENFHRPKSVGR